MATTQEALIDLSVLEGAITEVDATRLRGHVLKTRPTVLTLERLLVLHHRVPPEQARALRQRAEANDRPAAAPEAEAAQPAPRLSAPAPGPFAPAPRPADPQGLLLLYPLAAGAEPTSAQRAAARELGAADADALVRDPLPRLERAGTLTELQALAERLRAAGLDARALAALPFAEPRLVQRARLGATLLTLTGPGGEVEADATKPTFVVIGKGDRLRYVHVYAGGRAAPFEVHERTSFPELLNQHDPFKAFLKALQALPGVSVCDLLLVHASRVEQATPAVELPAPGPKTVASPRAIVLSRLLYETWLDGMSLDAATLEHAVQERAPGQTGRQPRAESASAGPSPEVDAAAPPSLSHVMRGGSSAPPTPPPPAAGHAQAAPAPSGAGPQAAAVLELIGERVKALGPMRIMVGAATCVLAFLIYILVQAGGGIVWHVKEDPAFAAAHAKNTIRIVVLSDMNLPACKTFRLKVLDSPEVRAVADQYVWQEDREEPRHGGYDRSPDYPYLQAGDGKVPFVFVYNAQNQCFTGIRGSSGMTPEQFVAFLAAAKANPVRPAPPE